MAKPGASGSEPPKEPPPRAPTGHAWQTFDQYNERPSQGSDRHPDDADDGGTDDIEAELARLMGEMNEQPAPEAAPGAGTFSEPPGLNKDWQTFDCFNEVPARVELGPAPGAEDAPEAAPEAEELPAPATVEAEPKAPGKKKGANKATRKSSGDHADPTQNPFGQHPMAGLPGGPFGMPPFGYGYPPFSPMVPPGAHIPPGLFGNPLFNPLMHMPPNAAAAAAHAAHAAALQAAMQVPKPPKAKKESAKEKVVSKAVSKACASKVTIEAPDVNAFDSVVLRRMPRRYTRVDIVKLLDQQGFAKKYRLVYCPKDFKRQTSYGYSIVVFDCHETAKHAKEHFQGYQDWEQSVRASTIEVSLAEIQGIDNYIARYRDSPVMHELVPDEYKPKLFDGEGNEQPFPEPLKPNALRAPSMWRKNAKQQKDPGAEGDAEARDEEEEGEPDS